MYADVGSVARQPNRANSPAIASRCRLQKRRSNRWHRPCRGARMLRQHAAASGHGAFVNGTCYASYISRSLPNVPPPTILSRPVSLSLFFSASSWIGLSAFRREKIFLSLEAGHLRPVEKKSRFQVAPHRGNHTRLISMVKKKRVFYPKLFCSHQRPRESLVYSN